MAKRFRHGIFVISLDFELYWGVRDKRSLESYGTNLRNTPLVVERLLKLFRRYEVSVTWSTVGMLYHRCPTELRSNLPDGLPGYQDPNLCPYRYIDSGQEFEDAVHFAPALLERISKTPGQELGTHTYSHFYCLEPGVTAQSFEADLRLAEAVGSKLGTAPVTLVFPRNQWRREFLEVLRRRGIIGFRGNERHWLYGAVPKAELSLWRRALKLVDSYVNLTGHHTFGPESCGTSPPYDIPASRFLRSYSSRLAMLEPLKRRRIVSAMTVAAQRRRGFHLWWHPHNFGKNLEQNFELLEQILRSYSALNESHGYQSMTMKEACYAIENGSLLE